MKILAVDTSSKICSVSILENDEVILEKHNNDEKTHSQNLMPLIDEIFKKDIKTIVISKSLTKSLVRDMLIDENIINEYYVKF